MKHKLKSHPLTNQQLILLLLAMLFVGIKLTCNPLFFRQVEFTVPFVSGLIKVNSSAFLYAATYVLCDAMVAMSNRKTTLIIILCGVICDGIFSYLVSNFSTWAIPHNMSAHELANTLAINQIGPQMWQLFYRGALASFLSTSIEVLIFAFLFTKSNNFFISTIFGVSITLLTHNLVTDYPMLKKEPDVWEIIFHNLSINICIVIIYASIVSSIIFLWNFKKKYA